MADGFSETWRPIPSLPGYEASDLGRIKGPKGIRKLRRRKQGYQIFGVTGGITVSVARCVCEAFNGPPPSAASEVDHINGVRDADFPHNLRWVSKAENLRTRRIARGVGHANSKLSDEAVRHIRSTNEPCRLLAEQYGVSRRTIRDARSGALWRHVDA